MTRSSWTSGWWIAGIIRGRHDVGDWSLNASRYVALENGDGRVDARWGQKGTAGTKLLGWRSCFAVTAHGVSLLRGEGSALAWRAGLEGCDGSTA